LNLRYKRNFIISTKAESLVDLVKKKILKTLFDAPLPRETITNPENNEEQFCQTLSRQVSSASTDLTFNKKRIPSKKKSETSVKCLSSNLLNSEISMSDISLNSDKTDCDDKVLKQKLVISPIDKNGFYEIISDFFESSKIQNSDDFFYSFFSGSLFGDLENTKTLQTVKNHYMRKRVCMKFYKIFSKLVSLNLLVLVKKSEIRQGPY
jgi:hypothetical protein